mgnify:CR=1 FL=1
MKREYTNEKRRTVIEVGRNVFLPYQAKITVPKFTVGDHTRINGPILIRGQEDCHIGKYCALGYNITIVTTNHDIRRPNIQVNMHRYFGFSSLEISKGPVRIGNSVWIGDNVTILSGATIGDGCVVGAGAVVSDDLPPCSIAVGAPAKVSRYRFDQRIIEQFLSLKWWDWSEEKIARNRKFFEADLTDCKDMDLADLVE